eukprot:1706196-Prymnesium_polylepis.1
MAVGHGKLTGERTSEKFLPPAEECSTLEWWTISTLFDRPIAKVNPPSPIPDWPPQSGQCHPSQCVPSSQEANGPQSHAVVTSHGFVPSPWDTARLMAMLLDMLPEAPISSTLSPSGLMNRP